MRYRIFGLVLESDVALPELRRSAALRPHVRAQLRVRRATPPPRNGWRREPSDGWMRISRRGSEWRIRFPGIMDFLVSEDAAGVFAVPPAAIPMATVRHLLIDQVIPLVLSARGHLILHGSAVASAAGAVMLVGPSRAGKSTLAVGLARGGWNLLSDDLVRIHMREGSATVTAAYAGARLWPGVARRLSGGAPLPRIAHYSSKRRLTSALFENRTTPAAPLHCIYLLGPSCSTIAIEPLSRRQAVIDLLAHATRLDTHDGAAEARRLDLLAALCETIPVRRLSYPRALERLDELREAIRADVSNAWRTGE